jgi:tetratricopeptide (TPR) repeat protein
MGRLCIASQHLRSAGAIRCGLAAFILLALLSMHAQEPASLRGTIRDSQGKPVAEVTVQLHAKDATPTQTVHTDSRGNYSFAVLHDGTYVLRAEMAGYSDAEITALFFSPKEAKSVDLTLLPAKTSTSQVASTSEPEFFDQPQFTVAGVTDTTSLGGHGSDTVVRTRETLAKETVSLGKDSPGGATGAGSDSEKSLREAVKQEPRSFEANHRLGKELVANGKAPEAIPYLERARQLKPDDYDNGYDLALADAKAGDYKHARDRAEAMLPKNDKAKVHHLLGDVEERLGNSLEAVREYQRAAQMDPSEAYIFDWGSELLLHHAPEPALEVFSTGNRLFPRSVRMLIGLGATWFARGSYDQAVERVCEASVLSPDDSGPYLFLGRMQSAESAPSEKTVEKLHRFVMQQPESAEANYYYAVGLWKMRKGQQDAASAEQVKSLLEKAIHLNPRYGAAYLQLGILQSEQRDYPKALVSYQQAAQEDPERQEAHYRLAQAYRQTGDPAKAEAELQIYDRLAKESAQRAERERHEIRQFVYTLRDQPPPQKQ